MTYLRREFLRLSSAALAFSTFPETGMTDDSSITPLVEKAERPLAERLAAYAHALRFEDLDAATVERIKIHVIDTIGCAIGALNEKPVRICRDVALSADGPATVIGATRRTTPDLATF